MKYFFSFLSFIWVVSSMFGCLRDVDSSSSLSSSIRGENCTVLVVMSPGYHAHSFYSYEVDSWFVFFCHFGCSEWTCHLFNLFVIWRIWIGMLPIRFIFCCCWWFMLHSSLFWNSAVIWVQNLKLEHVLYEERLQTSDPGYIFICMSNIYINI